LTVVYIAQIVIDASIVAKINSKHNVTREEVVEAIQWPAATRAAWEDHPLHGRRLIASGRTASDRRILAVLQPVDAADGTWRLRSARGD
jgi:hypothetical protein